MTVRPLRLGCHGSGVVALSFLSMVSAMSYTGAFTLFASISFLSTFFYLLALPETKVCGPPT
jgi:hypothetical protein